MINRDLKHLWFSRLIGMELLQDSVSRCEWAHGGRVGLYWSALVKSLQLVCEALCFVYFSSKYYKAATGDIHHGLSVVILCKNRSSPSLFLYLSVYQLYHTPRVCLVSCGHFYGFYVQDFLILSCILQTVHFGLTQEWFRELYFSRLECGVHDMLHVYPLCGIFYFPWHYKTPDRRDRRLL